MNWSDERYVRVYCRSTPDLIGMGWEARALFWELLRHADRAGMIAVGKHGVRALAEMLHVPRDIVESGLAVLLEDGCVRGGPAGLIIPNFLAAQEAPQSDAARKRAERERKRAEAIASSRSVTASHETVTESHEITDASGGVVSPRHEMSLRAVPCFAVPSENTSSKSDAVAGAPAPAITPEPVEERIRDVWAAYIAAWKSKVGKGSEPRFTKTRRGQITARLRDGYDVDYLKRAIAGVFSSDFHLGKNDSGKLYVNPDVIFRSAEQVEKHAGNTSSTKPGSRNGVALRQGLPGDPGWLRAVE